VKAGTRESGHASSPPSRRSRRRAVPRRQHGYSLIEVIVAFALLALALTLLLGTLSGATRQVRWSGDAGRAALHAQSLLDQVGVGEPLRPGQSDGDFDDGRYRWTLAITPWTDPVSPPGIAIDPSAPRLHEVSLSVKWGDGRPGEQLQLRTLRLTAAGTEAVLP
jgi:general secretion pathway protein I